MRKPQALSQIKQRSIFHPILQDGYELVLRKKQRCFCCTNPDCVYECNEDFRFAAKAGGSLKPLTFLSSGHSGIFPNQPPL